MKGEKHEKSLSQDGHVWKGSNKRVSISYKERLNEDKQNRRIGRKIYTKKSLGRENSLEKNLKEGKTKQLMNGKWMQRKRS